jgi:predicted nucleic acid-binding protein
VGQQILLDSTVVIAALSGSDSHHRNAQEILSSTARSQFAISAVSVGEVLIRPSVVGKDSVELFLSGLNKLVSHVIPFQQEHALLSASIRGKHKITFVDSMIIATALIGDRKLISFDRKMMGIYERVK